MTHVPDDAERVIDLAVKLLAVPRSDAEYWYKHEVIAELGMTAKQSVTTGHVEAVIEHLGRIGQGGYA